MLNIFKLLHCFFNQKWDHTANQIRTCFIIEWGTTSNHYFIHFKGNLVIFTWFWTLFHFCTVSSIQSEIAMQFTLEDVSALNGLQHLILNSALTKGNYLIFTLFWTLFHFCTVFSIQTEIALQIKLEHVSTLYVEQHLVII